MDASAIKRLLDERDAARKAHDSATMARIASELDRVGVLIVSDGPGGTLWKYRADDAPRNDIVQEVCCPSCKRVLLWVRRDGTFDAAGRAQISSEVVITERGRRYALSLPKLDVTRARCLRPLCRVRRALVGH